MTHFGNLNVPYEDKIVLLEEMPEKFPFVDVRMFSSYWKWYAETAIKAGQGKEEIIEIIQKVVFYLLIILVSVIRHKSFYLFSVHGIFFNWCYCKLGEK